MKKISILMILCFAILTLFLAGCSTTQDDSGVEITNSGKAICGNGMVEKGETAENCCADVPCQDGFECKNQLQDGNTIHFCKKLDKTETYEYEKFLQYKEEINYEYDKPEQSLVNWATMLSKSQSMSEYLTELESKDHDVSVEEEFMKHYDRRIQLNKLVYEKGIDFDSLAESKQKIIIDELITLYTNEKNSLESINGSMKIKLDKEFEYDINGKIEYANERITALLNLKEMLEKGQSAEIDVTTYDSTCYSSGEGYLTSVNLGIKNTGGFAIADPRLDFFLMEGGSQVAKETDEYFSYDDLEAEDEQFEKISFMLGYSSGDSIKCKTYDLKINLRSGANPKIIATKTVQVTLK